jgi:hypothetical protein
MVVGARTSRRVGRFRGGVFFRTAGPFFLAAAEVRAADFFFATIVLRVGFVLVAGTRFRELGFFTLAAALTALDLFDFFAGFRRLGFFLPMVTRFRERA